MRCCASSTTSTGASAPNPRSIVEATLFAAALKPLSASLGFLGEVVVDEVARDLFVPRPAESRDARP
jgi:hypothetical protein